MLKVPLNLNQLTNLKLKPFLVEHWYNASSRRSHIVVDRLLLQLDGSRIQSLCLQQGLLQTFFFNKSASHALACFMNRDDAISARATLGTFPFADSPHPLCCADIVTSDTAKSLLNSGQWTQLSTAAGLSSVAPPAAKGRGSSTYAPSDGM